MQSVQYFPGSTVNPCSVGAPHSPQNSHQYSIPAPPFTAATFKTSHQRSYHLKMAEALQFNWILLGGQGLEFFFFSHQMDNHSVMLGSGDHQRL